TSQSSHNPQREPPKGTGKMNYTPDVGNVYKITEERTINKKYLLAAAEAIYNKRHPSPHMKFDPRMDVWAMDYAIAAVKAMLDLELNEAVTQVLRNRIEGQGF